MPKDFIHEIQETIAVLFASASGWHKELNMISWNGSEPGYDIREWVPDHEKSSKSVTLTEEEAAILMTVLIKRIKGQDSVGVQASQKNEYDP